MNKNLQMVHEYHKNTKHSAQKYAKSLGYMDWNTQPNPYRSYENTLKTKLPLSFNNKTLEYYKIFENDVPSAPICKESISQFFQFSLGLAATKVYGDTSWDLRCNASSGNLQPSEAYIISSQIQGIENGIHHYAPKFHHLEHINTSSEDLNLPENSFLLSLSSIVWREAWKYGERAWRYTQLDCGHALRALEVSALVLGWKIEILNVKDTELNTLLGFDQEERYIKDERELADMLILVSLKDEKTSKNININELILKLENNYIGKANALSSSRYIWDILEKIENATLSDNLDEKEFILDTYEDSKLRNCTYLSKDVILERRSAQAMDEDDSLISKEEFETILSSVKSYNSLIHLIIFVHNVKDLDSGLYIMIRNKKDKETLQMLLKEDFIWEKIETDSGDLYLLEKGDFKYKSKLISCNQDIAKDGAFSLGMLAKFSNEIIDPSKYKQLYWLCGRIGQQLYLESTSQDLSATGIGCFLDDLLHDCIGLKNDNFQSLYHFTIGRALIDSRLSTINPYE